MSRAAIIFVCHENRRRQLAQRVSDLKMFDQLYFCSTLQELSTLLKSTAVELVFCEQEKPTNGHPEWADLVRKGQCRLICFTSQTSPESLRLSGGSCYLDQQIDTMTLAHAVKSVLEQSLESPPPLGTQIQDAVVTEQKIYSRFYFDTFVAKELSRSRLTGRPVSLLLIEPRINDRQQSDDQLLEPILIKVTRVIKNQIRSSDLLCRYQRQRLAILLPETGLEQAGELLERIRTNLRNSFLEERIFWITTIVSSSEADPENTHSFLQDAMTRLERSHPGC